MDLSQLAVLLQDLGDNAELAGRVKDIITHFEATDLLQHFYLDAVVTDECTTHVEYKVEQGLVPRKYEKRWFRKKESIGRGAYGRIWLEREEKAVNHRAVKIMAKDLMTRDGIDYKKEILALAKFSKPKYQQQEVLVKFLGWFEEPSDLFLYMEYFELGDLEHHITESITEDDVKDISTNLLNGLRIMHHEGFAHRDLKPGNIFVVQKPPSANWWVKIGDFGISKRVNPELTALYTEIGTRVYMAPEVTGDLDTDEPTSRYDNAVDIWSLGCVVYKVATQGVPFQTPRELRKFCAGGPFPEQPLSAKIAVEGVEFVKGLLVPDPQARLTANGALKVSWLSLRERDATRRARPLSENPIRTQAQASTDLGKPKTGPVIDIDAVPEEPTVRLSPPAPQRSVGSPTTTTTTPISKKSPPLRSSRPRRPMPQTTSQPQSSYPSPPTEDSIERQAQASADSAKPGTGPFPGTAELERRPARRLSMYQIQKQLEASANGPPVQDSRRQIDGQKDHDPDLAEPTARISTPKSDGPVDSSQPQSPQPSNKEVARVQRAITQTLATTKVLMEKLTEWSQKKASDTDISDAYQSFGYEFNMTCRAFNNVGIDAADNGDVVGRLRAVLEEGLAEEASTEALNKFLPRVRDIVVNMLHWMKKKQALLPKDAQKETPGDGPSKQSGGKRKDLAPMERATASSPNHKGFTRTDVTPKRTPAATAPTSDTRGDTFERPSDDVVDQLFLELMNKRGWTNLPEQAKRQMLAYPASKKWTLVGQDRLTELQGKRVRAQADDQSPAWYIKKLTDNTITVNELESLDFRLRTKSFSWFQAFVNEQGQITLGNALGKFNCRRDSQAHRTPREQARMERGREYWTLKCIQAVLNAQYHEDETVAHPQVVISIIGSLLAPGLNTRELATDMLAAQCGRGDGQGYQGVLEAMAHVKNQHGEAGGFDSWMRVFEATIDDHQDYRREGFGMWNYALGYYTSTTIFINTLVDAAGSPMARWDIRAQFIACGIDRILSKIEAFREGRTDTQIQHFRASDAADHENSPHSEIFGISRDLQNLVN